MAAAPSDPIQALLKELTCTVCLEGFRDPVMIIGCGHNFCRPCIIQYWGGSFRNVVCPQCRTTFSKAKLKPNRQLSNVVELTRDLSLQTPRDPPASPPSSSSLSEDLCPLHQKPLKLFCEKDGIPLCLSCHGAEDHRDHKVLPIEEAVQEQKRLIQSRLESLKKQKDLCQRSKELAKKRIQLMQNVEKQAVVAEIEQFCQFLKNQVEFLLPHLEVLLTNISKKEKEISGKLTGEIKQLNDFICDIEKTCEKPGVKLLKEVTRLNGLLSKGEILCSDMKMEDCQEYETTYS
nr:tripartite motif-containing protein 7-like isoform X1 [Pogona vitticeps]